MLHMLFDKRPWFARKNFGIGAGWPVAWQGWALLAAYLGTLAGISRLAKLPGSGAAVIAFVVLVIVTVIFAVIVHRHTEGGWRWRWGRQD